MSNSASEELLAAMNRLFAALGMSSLSEEEQLVEINALIDRLSATKRKRGVRSKKEVPMTDLAAALMYLRQPRDSSGNPLKSVEEIVREARKAVVPEEKRTGKKLGFDKDVTSDVHARRIRRLVKRIEKSGWLSLGEQIEAYIAEGGFTDLDN